ncbi:hypothetical protein ACH427_22920 [Streptomyces sp. NPDC020379]|uniref:hypothetical protein n=1 Tax=Streptomyces sp. NPDC020379 TaxID=3365071 RepID=UPI00379329DA
MTDAPAGFPVLTGDECSSGLGAGACAEDRAATVRQAMAGLRQIREITNPPAGHAVTAPAPWERLQPLRAIALALEDAGIPASALDADGRRTATGYRLRRENRIVRVEWTGPPGSGALYQQHEGLQRCARALQDLGWHVLEYRGARRHRWLEVEAPPL